MLIPLLSSQVWSGISLFFLLFLMPNSGSLSQMLVGIINVRGRFGGVGGRFSPIISLPGFKEMKFQTKFCHSLASKNPEGSQFVL